MSVNVAYGSTVTVQETLAVNTGSAPAGTRVVTHTDYNEAATLNASSTPPATTCSHFLKTLSGGSGSIDLTSLLGTNGATVDGSGLKVQVVRIKNLGANNLTVKSGASNGHTGFFTANTGHIIPPGGHIQIYTNDNGDDVDGTHKTWDLTGTGAQTSEWTIVLG